jgi:phosphoribosylformimino-5-aminoimidazole carboxamide ribotide isomerase
MTGPRIPDGAGARGAAICTGFCVIPAIDLKAGKVVRLRQGDMSHATIFGNDPAATARALEAAGARMIHVVDLDGAIAGRPCHLEAIAAIRTATTVAIDVSGGLRTLQAIESTLAAGAQRVALGSVAFLDPPLLEAACHRFPGRIFGSLDVRDGRLAIKGWRETSTLDAAQAAARFRQAGVAAIIHTDIARDGTNAGAELEPHLRLARASGLPVIASGGVASLEDLRRLREGWSEGVIGAIVGRALYEGRFTLAQALGAVA